MDWVRLIWAIIISVIEITNSILVLEELAEKVQSFFLANRIDWGQTGFSIGQHHGDLVVDDLCVDFLTSYGFSVFSEESGFTSAKGKDNELLVVLDPVDGSTNAAHELPLFALSAGILTSGRLVAGYVCELTFGSRYWAVNGHGAFWNGNLISLPNHAKALGKSLVAINGYPKKHLGWGQYRALGSAALELCMVASGQFDAFIDCSDTGLAPWDYLGALAILREVGCFVEPLGNDLLPDFDLLGSKRRRLVAARSRSLLVELRDSWQAASEEHL